MLERSDRVHLDPAEPRCAASHGCSRGSSCARRMAPIGAAPLGDYSLHLVGGWCMSFVAIVRAPAAAPAQRRVHPHLGSLS